jgi:hypothetical protein
MDTRHVPTVVRVEVLIQEQDLDVLDDIAVRSLQSRSELIRTALWLSYSPLLRRVNGREVNLLRDDHARYVDRVVETMNAELQGHS